MQLAIFEEINMQNAYFTGCYINILEFGSSSSMYTKAKMAQANDNPSSFSRTRNAKSKQSSEQRRRASSAGELLLFCFFGRCGDERVKEACVQCNLTHALGHASPHVSRNPTHVARPLPRGSNAGKAAARVRWIIRRGELSRVAPPPPSALGRLHGGTSQGTGWDGTERNGKWLAESTWFREGKRTDKSRRRKKG